MHGTLRFLLATLVVISHLEAPCAPYWGMPAVVVFFMLAGYVVTQLRSRHFAGPGRLVAFYWERFLRVAPVYYALLVPTTIFVFAADYGQPKLTVMNVVGNLTIVPLNYFMFLDVAVARHFPVLAPAWSLGLEIQAYMVLPLILTWKWSRWVFGLASLAVFAAAAISIVYAQSFCYRLLPGVLFMFLMGSALSVCHRNPGAADTFDRWFPWICWACVAVLFGVLAPRGEVHETALAAMLGVIVGAPLLAVLSRLTWKPPGDAALGQLSYGVFLGHMPVLYVYESCGYKADFSLQSFSVIMLGSVALAFLMIHGVERHVWPLRQRLTKMA